MNAALLFAQPDNTLAWDFFGGAMVFIAILWIVGVAATIFWIWMLVDVLVHERATEEKILWFLVVFFLQFIGALIYFIVRRAGRTRTTSAL